MGIAWAWILKNHPVWFGTPILIGKALQEMREESSEKESSEKELVGMNMTVMNVHRVFCTGSLPSSYLEYWCQKEHKTVLVWVTVQLVR